MSLVYVTSLRIVLSLESIFVPTKKIDNFLRQNWDDLLQLNWSGITLKHSNQTSPLGVDSQTVKCNLISWLRYNFLKLL